MKTAIVYHSAHHGNTKKLLDAIAQQDGVTLIAASAGQADLSGYDLIGFASGIYYQKFHASVLEFAEKQLPQGKNVFLIYTYGSRRSSYTSAIEQIVKEKGAQLMGAFSCPGFDTFGPFKLIGGISKGHPDGADIANAVKFFRDISEK